MEVYVYVDYREEKGGEIEFSTPEVYATQEEFNLHFRIRGIKADGSVENRGRRNRSEDKAVSL